jgi:hypothetical protein
MLLFNDCLEEALRYEPFFGPFDSFQKNDSDRAGAFDIEAQTCLDFSGESWSSP